jgi:ribonucleotide reductase alpha subunit
MKTYTYEEAFIKSKEYFKEDELATTIFLDKYALKNKEGEILEDTPDKMHKRIAKEFARVEKNKFKKPLTEEDIYNYFKDFKYIIPQGSGLSGIGDKYRYTSLSNCFVGRSPVDSYSGICKTDEEIVNISKRRGGVGIDISNLRPKGSATTNASKTSTGIVSFMQRFSNTIREVGQAGRRGALIITISIHHPEILNFITAKTDLKKVTGANLSIRLTDEFFEALEKNEQYEQRFPVDAKKENIKFSQMVDAKKIWDEIIKNAHAMGEPGLLMWNNIIRESPADCYKEFKTISTNPSLRKNTLVSTDKGVFPIRELAENDYNVKVRNLRGEWHNCNVFKSGHDKQLMKITFSNKQVVYCTPEHKWPILNTTNNIINKYTGKVLKKKTKDLEKQDKIYFPSFSNPINNKGCKYSKEDGFVLGWNLGDGWTSYHKVNKSRQYGFIFSKEDIDCKIGDKVLNYTNKIAKINSTLKQDHNTNSYTYCTTDTSVINSFEEKGLYSKKEGIPYSIWEGNKEYIKGFIDGLFSADGCIRTSDKISRCGIILVSSHKKIISDIQKLLNFYGIRSSYKKTITKSPTFPNGKTYNKKYTRFDLVISGINVLKFGKYFSLSNKSKQEKINKILKKTISYNSKGRIEYANNREYLSVRNIEETNIYEDVYDITVFDDTHTFLMETGITGNCSELPLSELDSCRLLLLNLYSFVDDPFTNKAKFNFDKFYKHAQIAQRLMDDMIDLEIEHVERIINKIKKDPEPIDIKRDELELWEKIKATCQKGRRTGTGVNAVGDTIAACGYEYGSKKSIKFISEIFKTLKLGCYRSSVDMAKELGPFKVWNHKLEKKNPFLLRIKEEDEKLWKDMKKYGRRNIGLLTLAPSGSVSIETKTTSGIEPLFQLSYIRRKKINENDNNTIVDFEDANGDKWQEFEVFHPKVKIWKEVTGESDITKSPWYGCCAEDINWEARVELQATANRHIDHSISSTINLPEDVPIKEVSKIYTSAWKKGVKGITVYRKNCRSGVLVDKNKEKGIQKNTAPKRPRNLPCDIFHVSVKGEPFFVIVGKLYGEPYEVFAGKNGVISKSIKHGIVRKRKRGSYILHNIENDDILHGDIGKYVTDEQETITRLISSNLRHGCDVGFIVHQLEKTTGDLMSFSKAVSRVLKKYIKEGASVHGEECPECENKLIRAEGCISCSNCSWSRCG